MKHVVELRPADPRAAGSPDLESAYVPCDDRISHYQAEEGWDCFGRNIGAQAVLGVSILVAEEEVLATGCEPLAAEGEVEKVGRIGAIRNSANKLWR